VRLTHALPDPGNSSRVDDGVGRAQGFDEQTSNGDTVVDETNGRVLQLRTGMAGLTGIWAMNLRGEVVENRHPATDQ
jgi:hypothetical protein